ncbi:MAG TPA: sirohydrochlorin nickelochelatase [Candidatus Acidoferrales bacterium]|nr:sirohydrochlorin nickelochelatase [Candidatus Acidoferrales bacterium]
MQDNCGVLILGHGSKLAYNKNTIEAVAAMLAEKMTNATVKTAYLNIDHPTIEEGLASFTKTGVKTLYVLPLFLAHGTHTLKDIPEVLGLTNGQRRTTLSLGDRSVDIVYAEPLGIDPCIADLALKRLQEA